MELNYIIVPLIGAVIGYTTNWLAIKMLFRPRKPKYIFGIRLPFTPGLIPKERNRIASSLGTAVSNNLLNEETLTRELLDERILAGLDEYLDKVAAHELIIDDLLNYLDFDKEIIYGKLTESIIVSLKETANNDELRQRLIGSLLRESKLKERLPENSIDAVKKVVTGNQDRINQFLIRNLRSESFQEKLYEIIDSFIAGRLKMIRPFIKTESISNAINETISSYLLENPESVTVLVNSFISDIGERELKDIISENQTNRLADEIIRMLNSNIDKKIVRDSIHKTIINLAKRRFTFNPTTVDIFKASVKRLYVDFIETQASRLIAKLDINNIVESKINSFSTSEMEDLILGLMKKELNTITSLGALLGFVMGIVSLLFN